MKKKLKIIMNSTDPFKLSEKELLIRMDERQMALSKSILRINEDVSDIKKVLISTDDYKNFKDDFNFVRDRVDSLWDWRNRIIGYAAAAGAFFGSLSGLLLKILESQFFK